jgi:integrase
VRKIYNWGMAEGHVVSNPAVGTPMRAPERTRERVLSDDELFRFWSALEQSGFEQVTADVLRLQFLLGARIREITDLRRQMTGAIEALAIAVRDKLRICNAKIAEKREVGNFRTLSIVHCHVGTSQQIYHR